ncbi:MAG: serine/threonine protein kinase [Planctomycetes bacterium]|nr:serine/threonine protein kinase [Planctomycetota bacterium]
MNEGSRRPEAGRLDPEPDPRAIEEALRDLGSELFGPSPRADFGPYRFVAELGRGGQAVVFRAVDTRLQRTVALKLLRSARPDDTERGQFHREARAAASLRHPAVCTVFEAGDIDGQSFVAMEIVAGPTLQQCIDRHVANTGRPPGPVALPHAEAGTAITRLRAIVAVLEQVALGLQHAHDHGVLHRDLKPSNIALTDDGQPVILDFGLAHRLRDSDHVDQAGAVPGTPGYIAPEAFDSRSEPPPDSSRLDVWSLGVIAYVLVSGGRPPFPCSPIAAWLDAVHRSPPPAVSGLPPTVGRAVDELLRLALAPEPRNRLASPAEFASRLRELDALASRVRSRTWSVALAGLLTTSLVTVAVALVRGDRRASSGGEPGDVAAAVAAASTSADDTEPRSLGETPAAIARPAPELESLEVGWRPSGIGPTRRRASFRVASADGRSFVGCSDGDLVLQRFDGAPRRFHSGTGELDCVVITADGGTVAGCQGVGRVVWFDVSSGVESRLEVGPDREVSGLAPHGTDLLVIVRDGIRHVDPTGARPTRCYDFAGDGLPEPILDAVLLDGSRALLRGGDPPAGSTGPHGRPDHRLALASLDVGAPVASWSGQPSNNRLIDIVDATGRFATLDPELPAFHLRDRDGRSIASCRLPPDARVLGFSLARDGRLFVATTGSDDDPPARLHVLAPDGAPPRTIPIQVGARTAVPLALPDPTLLLLTQDPEGFDIIDLDTGRVVAPRRDLAPSSGKHWIGPRGNVFYTCSASRGALRATPIAALLAAVATDRAAPGATPRGQ